MLGWCTGCQRLKPITRLPTQLREGLIDYGPINHPAPPVHTGCDELVVLVSEDDEPNIDGAECRCVKCGLIPETAVTYPPGDCRGSRKPIR